MAGRSFAVGWCDECSTFWDERGVSGGALGNERRSNQALWDALGTQIAAINLILLYVAGCLADAK